MNYSNCDSDRPKLCVDCDYDELIKTYDLTVNRQKKLINAQKKTIRLLCQFVRNSRPDLNELMDELEAAL